MPVVFKVSDKPFFKDNPSARAVKVFNDLGEEAMKYIALVYMYKTPLKNLPLEKRKQQAIKEADIPKTPTGRPSKLESDLLELRTPEVQAAIDLFKELQFDEDRDLYEALSEMINDFKLFMRKQNKSAQEIEKAIKIAKELPSLKEKQNELAEILDLRDEQEITNNNDQPDDDSDEMSLIEKILSR